jgi:hypothetical protein
MLDNLTDGAIKADLLKRKDKKGIPLSAARLDSCLHEALETVSPRAKGTHRKL